MKFRKSVGSFFALDIGTTALRVVELSHSGSGWDLKHYGVKEIDSRLSESTAEHDRRALCSAIKEVIGTSDIKTNNVAIGIPSNRMFASVVNVPTISSAELNATIKYQAENYVPMRADEAKIDWAIIGKSPSDDQTTEVLVASVQNTFTESRLDLLESIGLNVIAIEPDSLAITRALLPDGVQDGRIIIDMGATSTDLIVTLGSAPRLIRSIPIGLQTLIRLTSQNLQIDPSQSEGIILKFGIDPKNLEGKINRSVQSVLDQFGVEIIKSLKFFVNRYPKIGIGSALLSGYAALLPGMPEFIAKKANITTQISTPWQHVNVPVEMQSGLAPLSASFAVSVGLAERQDI